jgi:hypothetical protein
MPLGSYKVNTIEIGIIGMYQLPRTKEHLAKFLSPLKNSEKDLEGSLITEQKYKHKGQVLVSQ